MLERIIITQIRNAEETAVEREKGNIFEKNIYEVEFIELGDQLNVRNKGKRGTRIVPRLMA